MFSFEAPEGYRLEQPDEQDRDPFGGGEGAANADRLSVRFVLVIDERAVLACWLHEKRGPDGPARPGWVADVLRMEFSGAHAKRPCEWHLIRQQQDGERLWNWSLVLPRDRRPLKVGEPLDIMYEGRGGTIMMSDGPLRFDDERLAKIIERLQAEAFSEPPADEPLFTLAELRERITEVLEGAAPVEK